jgi:hypothetical protein
MRPHRTDGISLSFGTIFLLVAIWWAVAQLVAVKLPPAGWLVAGALILFGAIGLLGAIRSGRRTEVPAPVHAEAQVETPGDLPPEMHADIVRELLDNPADRVDLQPATRVDVQAANQGDTHPAYLKHAVPEAPAMAEPTSAPPAAGTGTAETGTETADPIDDEPTTEVTRVDLDQAGEHDGDRDQARHGSQDGDPEGTPRRG